MGNHTEIEPYREEIEQRTRNGETCHQIAAALKAEGFDVSDKTVSRWRIVWGLRSRTAGTIGRKYPDRKLTGPRVSTKCDEHGIPRRKSHKIADQAIRKADITARTARGESAEEIAAALAAQGVELKKGVSTIWRLQTTWKLIPYDKSRARGNWKRAKDAANAPRKEKAAPKPRKKKDAAPDQATNHTFYPAGLTNGPQGLRNLVPETTAPDLFQQHDAGINPDIDPGLDDIHVHDDFPASDAQHSTFAFNEPQQTGPPPVNGSAQLMAAELYVGLAANTLAATQKLLAMYQAQHANRPLPDSATGLLPTDAEIAETKLKIREAAAVLHNLAVPDPTANAFPDLNLH